MSRSFGRGWALLLGLGVALSAWAGPPASSLPGREPDSTEPWDLFLGRAAHTAIGQQYRVEHPTDRVFLDTVDLQGIMTRGRLGDSTRLTDFVRRLRPDITNATGLVLFEIKPDTEEGLKQGREQAGRYLAALNGAVDPDKKLMGGTGFDGGLFIEFKKGGALWRLSWRTPEAGVTLYRWTYRRKTSAVTWKERAAQPEEALPRAEVEIQGEMAESALRAAYEGSDFPHDFEGRVYLPVDCH